jgi:hypothetical protein
MKPAISLSRERERESGRWEFDPHMEEEWARPTGGFCSNSDTVALQKDYEWLPNN